MRLKLIAGLLVTCAVLSAQSRPTRKPTARPVPAPVARSLHLSLNGIWEFLPDSERKLTPDQLPASGWRKIEVPLSIQAQFADLRDFQGVAWYRRPFNPPPLRPGEHLLLRFGAVDYLAEVFVNGTRVGQHEGGYTPFAVDASPVLRPGVTTLLVKVTDPPAGEDYKQIPHGKQTWYVHTTGLWQDVSLERRPAYYIETAHAVTEKDKLRGFRVRLAHPETIPAGAKATIEVAAPGAAPQRRELMLQRQTEQVLDFALQNARLWSPEDPALYRFTITLPNGDRMAGRFGFRTIETRDGRLFLNGKPLYMMGALDQNFYPDGVYSLPSKDYIVREMKLARELGLNLLRCHIKVPDPRYLDAADETGMLIWYEIPNWDELTDKAKLRSRQTLEEMMARDWNHPAIIVQTIINESWGIDLSQADQRAWLAEMTDFARRNLPNRLVVDNSACSGNFHLTSDLADYHNYNSIPDSVAAWDQWVAEFAARPAWLWSKHGDARATGREPLIVSEFGNWGLPQLPEKLPWWFERGMGKSVGSFTSPAGLFDRFMQYGLERVFASYSELARAAQQHEWEQLRHEIISLRRQPAIQGYVITEFTDLNWEGNGLLTMWREPKTFQDDIAALQRPVALFASAEKPNYRYDESVRIEVTISNYSPQPLGNLSLRSQDNTIPLGEIASGAVVALDPIYTLLHDRAAPPETESMLRDVDLELQDAAGNVVASHSLPVAMIAPVGHGAEAVRLPLEATDPEWTGLRQRLAANRYKVGPEGVLITPRWDAAAQHLAEDGGAVIVLANAPDAFTAGSIKTVARTGDLSGDWISNFNWFDSTRPPFQEVAVQKIAGWETRNIVPRYLLGGAEPEQYADVLAGFFLGWVRQPHAITLQAHHGKGSVIVTTLPLAGQYGQDAYATALLDSLIKYIAGKEFSAKMAL